MRVLKANLLLGQHSVGRFTIRFLMCLYMSVVGMIAVADGTGPIGC